MDSSNEEIEENVMYDTVEANERERGSVQMPARLTKTLPPNEDVLDSTVDYLIAKDQLRRPRETRNDALPPFTAAYCNNIAWRSLRSTRKQIETVRREVKTVDADIGVIVAQEKELIGTVLKFDTFVKQCQEQKVRATVAKAKETKKLYTRQKELMSTALATEHLLYFESVLQTLTSRYSEFEHFLNRVADSSDRYLSLIDVTNRYESLTGVRESLSVVYTKYIDEVESLKIKMYGEAMEITSKMLVYVNKLKQAEDKLKQLTELTAFWENRLLELSGSTAAKFADMTQVSFFVMSFLQEMVENRVVEADVFELPLEKKFELIRDKYFLLKKIVKSLKRKHGEEHDRRSN